MSDVSKSHELSYVAVKSIFSVTIGNEVSNFEYGLPGLAFDDVNLLKSVSLMQNYVLVSRLNIEHGEKIATSFQLEDISNHLAILKLFLILRILMLTHIPIVGLPQFIVYFCH